MILIKDMKMPKSCIHCPFIDFAYGSCNVIGETVDMSMEKRAKNCPLVEVETESEE